MQFNRKSFGGDGGGGSSGGEGGVMSLALRGVFVGVCIAVTVWREERCLGEGCSPNGRKRNQTAAALPASLNIHL